MNIEKVHDGIKGYATANGNYLTSDQFRELAADIAKDSIMTYVGELLDKALDISRAIAEFANQLSESEKNP